MTSWKYPGIFTARQTVLHNAFRINLSTLIIPYPEYTEKPPLYPLLYVLISVFYFYCSSASIVSLPIPRRLSVWLKRELA